MNQQRWQLVKSVFQAALQLPPDQRSNYVQDNCEDADVRDEVLRMIELHDDETDFLKSPLSSTDNEELLATHPKSSSQQIFDLLLGQKFDDFEIVRRIGSGGMGVVFEARQQHPQRLAAIKIMNPTGAIGEKNLVRFEHEAEILGRLQHPGIAQVYAAGWHDFGQGKQPWFAMELIDGQPLHQTVKNRAPNIATRDKIQLLLSICDAVQHAHNRGVIHRDLKPANILIIENQTTAHSGAIGQPKIVDFGVARIMDSDRRATLQTATGDILGTLNYMCAEQVLADPALVDERCDVYALGVIGFELLAGCLPHDRRSSSIAASLRQVQEDTPKRLGHVDPSFRGDLQVIFEKVLQKDPAQRYGSVQDFADDLRRFLNREPIQARPPSTLYRCRKFISRHRALVGGTAATIAALLIGLLAYANEARQARNSADQYRYEAEKGTAIGDFMANDFLMKLLAAVNENETGERPPTEELVHRAANKVGAMFGDRPTIEAAVRNQIGTLYYNLNLSKQAAEEFSRALDLWQTELGPDHIDTLKAVNNLAQSYQQMGERDEAEPLFRRALDGRTKALGESDPATLASMNNLANLFMHSGRADEAEPMFRRALELQAETIGESHTNTIILMINLGNLLRQRSKVEEALSVHKRAYNASREALGSDHITALHAGSSYAQTLYASKNYDDASDVLLPIANGFDRVSGPSSFNTVTARRLLARIYRDDDKMGKAREQLRIALNSLNEDENASQGMIRTVRRELKALEKKD